MKVGHIGHIGVVKWAVADLVPGNVHQPENCEGLEHRHLVLESCNALCRVVGVREIPLYLVLDEVQHAGHGEERREYVQDVALRLQKVEGRLHEAPVGYDLPGMFAPGSAKHEGDWRQDTGRKNDAFDLEPNHKLGVSYRHVLAKWSVSEQIVADVCPVNHGEQYWCNRQQRVKFLAQLERYCHQTDPAKGVCSHGLKSQPI